LAQASKPVDTVWKLIILVALLSQILLVIAGNMSCASLLLVAFCYHATQIFVAAKVNEDTVNCVASPDTLSGGGHVMLQHSDVHGIIAQDDLDLQSRWRAIGKGQCVDASDKTEPSHEIGGWAPCTCNKPFASICTAGSCPSIEVCKAECDAEEKCGAVNWYPGHCWMYGPLLMPYTKTNTEFAMYDCYIRGTFKYSLVQGPSGKSCAAAGMISESAGAMSKSDCEGRCSDNEACQYVSHWTTGGVGWCRLSSSCGTFDESESGEVINIYQKISFGP